MQLAIFNLRCTFSRKSWRKSMLENSCLELMPFLKWNSSFKQVLENFPLLIVLLAFAHFLPKLEKISHFKRWTCLDFSIWWSSQSSGQHKLTNSRWRSKLAKILWIKLFINDTYFTCFEYLNWLYYYHHSNVWNKNNAAVRGMLLANDWKSFITQSSLRLHLPLQNANCLPILTGMLALK